MERQIENYLEYLRAKNMSRRTVAAYAMHLTLFFRYFVGRGKHDAKELTLDDLKEYHKYLLTVPGKKEGTLLSLETLHFKMRIVKKFFEYLESRQMVLVNPAERLDLPNLGSRLPPAVLKEHEMSRLLSRPNVVTDLGLRDRAILEVLYSTAIRRSECCSLMVQDVDLEGGFLRVNLGKGRKGRVVPLGKKACDYLKQYLLKVRPKLTNNPDCQHLFIGAWQKPLEGEGLNQIVRKYAVKADIQKPVTVHTFRRSAITHMLKGNAHPMYLQRMLGHATSETVRKYVKMTAKEIKATHNRTHPLEKSRNAKLRRTAEKIH